MTHPEAIYFTIKRNFTEEEVLVQRRIESMTQTADGYWHFQIAPEDTEGLNYGQYCWDLEVIQEGFKTTIARGYLQLTNEATFASNED